MKVKDYKELFVWQKGLEIVDRIYEVTDKFPGNEKYGLASQMRRASISIPSNISEGFVRHYTKEFLQFLHLSLGSCAELETQLIIAKRRNYVLEERLVPLMSLLQYECKMLVRLIQSLQRLPTNNK